MNNEQKKFLIVTVICILGMLIGIIETFFFDTYIVVYSLIGILLSVMIIGMALAMVQSYKLLGKEQ